MMSSAAGRPACFLDRDGTVTEERGYASSADEIVLLPGAAAAIRQLNQAGLAAVLVTNQSGIGRGYFDQAALAAQHRRLTELLAAAGARLEGIYYCPHQPAAGCACRKPAAGMLEQAARELGLDLARSWMIGDRLADIECGERGAAGGVLVLTGYGAEALASNPDRLAPERVCADLPAAVERVISLVGVVGRESS